MAVLRNYVYSDKINKLSWGAECLFNRLLSNVDTYANFFANPVIIKSQLFPLKEDLRTSDIERWLEELSKTADDSAVNGTSKEATALIRFYSAEGKRYLHLNGFRQNLRWMKRKVPAPPPEVEAEDDVDTDIEVGSEGELPLRVPKQPGKKKNVLKQEIKKAAILFRDSEWINNLAGFKEQFKDDELYSKCDLEYYYQRLLNWSNSNEGKNKRSDWIASAKNFMLGDAAEGKLKIGQSMKAAFNNPSGFPNFYDAKFEMMFKDAPQKLQLLWAHWRNCGLERKGQIWIPKSAQPA